MLGEHAMKIVVWGPERRTGAVHEGMVVDLCGAYGKYAAEKTSETHPMTMAETLVPSDLARFILGGERAMENAERAVDYLFSEAQDRRDRRGTVLAHPVAGTRIHAPRPAGARIACAGGNFADHAAAMAEKMQRKPYTGDAAKQIRDTGIWGFWKIHRAVVGPDGDVVYPQKATRLDYEGELAIVLGKRGTDIKAEQAADYIWGVTLLGD